MNSLYLRLFLIAVISMIASNGLDYWLNIETSLGLDSLFQLRGARPRNEQVVIVAMDEASELQLGLGHDLTAWRGHHAQLIRQLQAQGVKLIAFDLQFLQPQGKIDSELARAMSVAGNVLLVECVQKLRHATEDFFGRDECSETNKMPYVEAVGASEDALPEPMIAMRQIAPLSNLASAALDFAPVYLTYDSSSSVVREVWIYLDALGEVPNLPLVAWLHYLQLDGQLQGPIPPSQPLSYWLMQARRECLIGRKQNILAASGDPLLVERLQGVICGNDSRFLDFYGPQKTLRMESYSDVYFGKVNDLRDKVVFVGKANRRFSPGRTDYFATPFVASGKTAGVEILATEFANLLENRFVKMPVSPFVFSCGYGLLLGLLLLGVGGLPGAMLALGLTLLYAIGSWWLFQTQALWLPVASPILLQLPSAALLTFLINRHDWLRERRSLLAFVGKVFPQWLDVLPGRSEPWLSSDRSAEPAKRDIHGLCLATDIEGYTGLAGQFTPDHLWQLLNGYYQAMGRPVEKYAGMVLDVTGDSMMAVWQQTNAEVRHHNACRAALEISQAVDYFCQSEAFAFPTRMGLFEGDMTLGSVHTGNGIYYRAFGDAINVASRIQGVNKYLGSQVLASAAIVADLKGFDCRPVGFFRLLGRAEPVELVEIIGHLRTDLQAQRQQFAKGLLAFQAGDWQLALDTFAALQVNETDGPAGFFKELAERYLIQPPENWDGVVVLDGK